MRTIKFRIYDRKEKRMKLVVALEYNLDFPDTLECITTYPVANYQ